MFTDIDATLYVVMVDANQYPPIKVDAYRFDEKSDCFIFLKNFELVACVPKSFFFTLNHNS